MALFTHLLLLASAVAAPPQDVCLSDGQTLPLEQTRATPQLIEYAMEDHWLRVPRTALGTDCDGSLRWRWSEDQRALHLGRSTVLFGAPRESWTASEIRLLDGQTVWVERGLIRRVEGLPLDDPALRGAITLPPVAAPDAKRQTGTAILVVTGVAVAGFVAFVYSLERSGGIFPGGSY